MEVNSEIGLFMRGVIYNQSIEMSKTVNNIDINIIITIQEVLTFAFVTFGISMTGMKLDIIRS
jgi:hypothetical protein